LVLGGAATFARLFWLDTAIEQIQRTLRIQAFERVLLQPIAFFDSRRTGELLSRLGNDVTTTSKVLIDLSAGCRSVISATAGTAIIAYLAPPSVLVTMLSPAVLLFGVGFVYGRFVRDVAKRRTDALADTVTSAEQTLNMVRTVRSFNAEEKEIARFASRVDEVYDYGWKAAVASSGLRSVFFTGGGMFLLHILFQSSELISAGVLTSGTAVSLAMYSFTAGAGFQGIVAAYGDVQMALGACQQVLEVLRMPPGVALGAPTNPARIDSPDLRLDGVSFSFPARPETRVLKDISFHVPAGETLAIVGLSGSGKSTVLSLLAGFYKPDAGSISVGGQCLSQLDERELRSKLGIVLQLPDLFPSTIRENIEYSGGEFGEEAARIAQVNFVESLPAGLDTHVGDRGAQLSGGERQRVAIARAFAHRPPVLLLDEPTASLDTQSERKFIEALAGHGRTAVLVTHRMSMLALAQHLAVMDNGCLVQCGEKVQVMSKPCEALQKLLPTLQ
jgi:ABC-type multidrug transport system fused ATPase/permease subunit